MVGKRLKELRKEHNLSQEQLAKILNLGRSTYAHYENNAAMPDLILLKKIANYYSVSIDFLCENTDIKNQYYNDAKLCGFLNDCIKAYTKLLNK
ncbi:helix-turn-helix domain-containing protein [Clostridium butyricum]|uniref:helix-turn-helix domain-containing protein n=1 Tax=Clostridium butyricum TaxID=1492 RepID=UPI00210655D2|nr:helix-turn-helix transcriptional regulator [Clostridium butyricum]MCQ2014624.1 helix-turn-helix domain-containing protein [Clostridium butyricum]MCQ2027109.1 helix-turn-helix domain-containing protein [Clostridium butyricum]